MPATKTPEKAKSSDNGELTAPGSENPASISRPSETLRRVRSALVLLSVFLGGQICGIIVTAVAFHPYSRQQLRTHVSLGRYRFIAPPEDPGQLRACEFELTVVLHPEKLQQVAVRFEREATRFRQAVEELLRQARSTDFADPSLRHLKRFITAKLNELLGVNAVTEAFITDFRPDWGRLTEEHPQSSPPEPLGFPPRATLQLPEGLRAITSP